MKVQFYEGLESEYNESLHSSSIYKCSDTKNVYIFGVKQQSEYDKLCHKLIVGKAIPQNLRKGNRYYFRKRITIKSDDVNAFKTGLVKDIESWGNIVEDINYKVNCDNGDDYSNPDISLVESYVINNRAKVINILCIINISHPLVIQINDDGIISESGKASYVIPKGPSDIRKQDVYIDQDGFVRTNSQKNIDKVTILKFRRCRIHIINESSNTHTNKGMKKYWKRCHHAKIDNLQTPNTIDIGSGFDNVPRNTVIHIYYKKGHIKNPVYRVETLM